MDQPRGVTLDALILAAVIAERERCAQVAESFIPSRFSGTGKLGNSFAVARDDRARTIAYVIRMGNSAVNTPPDATSAPETNEAPEAPH